MKYLTILSYFIAYSALATIYAPVYTPVAVNIFVASAAHGGSDSNPGTQASPILTIAKVNTLLLPPNSRVNFNGGDVFSDTPLVLKSGYITGNNVYQSYGVGQAIISLGTNFGIVGSNISYCTINNLFVSNSMPNTSGVGNPLGCIYLPILTTSGIRYNGILITNCATCGGFCGILALTQTGTDGYDNMLVSHCLVTNFTELGIFIYGGDAVIHNSNILFLDNAVGYCTGDTTPTIGASGCGIVIANARDSKIARNFIHDLATVTSESPAGPGGCFPLIATNCYVESNVVCRVHCPLGADGSGVSVDASTTNCFVRYNYSYDCDGPGILEFGGSGNILSFNLVNNCGLTRQAIGGALLNVNCIFYNNTIVENQAICLTVGGTATIYNNIFQTYAASNINSSGASTLDYNCYNSPSIFSMGYNGVTYTFAAFKTASGQETHGTNVDPMLVNHGVFSSLLTNVSQISTNIDLAPSSGSPVIAVGKDITGTIGQPATQDVAGNGLVVPYNIGAWNISGTQYDPGPITSVAWHRLNEGLGTSAFDSTGNGNTMTLTAPTWSSGFNGGLGPLGEGALTFVSSTPTKGVIGQKQWPQSALTIAMWVTPNSLTGQSFFDYINDANGSSDTFYAQFDVNADGSIDAVMWKADGSAAIIQTTAAGTLTVGVQHHIAMTWSGGLTPAAITIYVDGVSSAITPSSFGTFLGPYSGANAAIFVGGKSGGVNPFDGKINDHRVYSSALTQLQDAALFAAKPK